MDPLIPIPKKGRAGVCVNEGPDFYVEVREVDVPEPGPDDLLVRINATGICQSDVHFMMNDLAVPPMSAFQPLHPCAGHEGAGVVAKLGARVAGWRVGERAGIKPIFDVCGRCAQCQAGRENYCAAAVFTGLAKPGSFCEFVVSPARYTVRIPAGNSVPDELAAPLMCSAATMHRALVESALRPGDWVVFPGGGGGVGANGIQLAKAMGLRAIAIDAGEEKRRRCIGLGAEAFIDFRETQDVAGRVKEVADGIGAHGVFVTAYQAYKDAVSYVGDRVGARIMAIALPPSGTAPLELDPNLLVAKNIHVIGTLVGGMQDIAQVLDYAHRGLIQSIAEVRGLSRFNESVQALRRGEVAGRIVISFAQD